MDRYTFFRYMKKPHVVVLCLIALATVIFFTYTKVAAIPISDVCGNSLTELSEQCDDGNTVTETCAYGQTSCMICDSMCQLVAGSVSYCGDSVIKDSEQCDDGNVITETCAYGEISCTVCDENCQSTPGVASYCGDSVLSNTEQCDDGNTVSGDGCSDICTSESLNAICGNGIVETDETCDDGNTITEACAYGQTFCAVCDLSCQSVSGVVSYCGDGVLNDAEQCDDGNTVSGDGCSDTCATEATPAVNVSIAKIVCTNESDLPNWGMGGADITSSTASDFLASHPNCYTEAGWSFQWGLNSVSNPGDNTGEAPASGGWNTVGPTDSNGVTAVAISDLQGSTRLKFREIYKEGYVPFTYGTAHGNNNNVSAEVYCHKDVLNYDNYDYIDNPQVGQTYYCVAFNASKPAVCGNRVVEIGEQCDDGNRRGGDGCSCSCKIEQCGDSKQDANEQCDDGNTVSGDGCSATCMVEKCPKGAKKCIEGKITICHIPPGNRFNPQTISVSLSALKAHLDHGDTLGKCSNLCR